MVVVWLDEDVYWWNIQVNQSLVVVWLDIEVDWWNMQVNQSLVVVWLDIEIDRWLKGYTYEEIIRCLTSFKPGEWTVFYDSFVL